MNCWGLADSKKRKDVFNFLKSKKHSFYFIQDTHFTDKLEPYIRSEWGFECFFSSNNTQSRGVAILLNNNFEYKMHNVWKCPNGNLLILDITIDNCRYSVANLYGPNDDNPQFYVNLLDQLKKFGNEYYVLAGDWNLVLDQDLDTSNYLHNNNPKAKEEVYNMIADRGLVDIWRDQHPDILRYTWRRKTPFRQARLDFFLTSETLCSHITTSDIHAGYRTDHSLVSIGISLGRHEKRSTYWKFNTSLLRDLDYVREIKQVISDTKKEYAAPIYDPINVDNIPISDIQLTLNDQLFFETLLLNIRGKTISYSSFLKKCNKKKEETLLEEIDNLEQQGPLNHDLIESKRKELQDIRKIKMDGVYIRSRAKWIDEGEKISRYFCNLENRNFVSKAMSSLETDKGVVLSNTDEILKEVKSFYEKLYSSQKVSTNNTDLTELPELKDLPKLDSVSARKLEGLITYEELADALQKMKNNKSPGSDGFSAEFFKFFWKDLGHFMLRSVNEAFERGELSVTQKHGVITCIPKKNKPKQFITNWRPISLLNVVYKAASSCIAERFKKVLPTLISLDQTGFLSNRYIGDNIRLLYDVMSYCERHDIPGMLLLVDFEKAFDSISWSFIQQTLSIFGFGPDISRWLSVFYQDIKSSVIVNGKTSSCFSIGRGCRQGDPLSPYIFILCAEILGCMIRNSNNITGIKINDHEYRLSQYADDTSFILDGSACSLESTVDVLHQFANMSGLKVNYNKSEIVWIGAMKNSPVRFIPHCNFKWNPTRFKVLGINFCLDTEQMVELNYNSVFKEIKDIITKWMKRIITPLGKIAIIKALLISKLNFLLLSLPSPSCGFIKDLNSLLFKFLWSSRPDKIKRELICKPIKEGGLGMINVSAYVKSLKIIWIRNLVSKKPCWINVVKAELHELDLDNIPYLGVDFVKQLLHKIHNPFWKDCFQSFHEFGTKTTVDSFQDFLSEPIFFNPKLKIDNSSFFYCKWYEKGISQIGDVMESDGTCMSFERFCESYSMDAPFLTYHGVICSIKQYLKGFPFRRENTSDHLVLPPVHRKLLSVGKGAKVYYYVLVSQPTVNISKRKWQNEFMEELDWSQIHVKAFQTTQDTRLRWFQYRIINRILTTNLFLCRIKLKDTSLCTFCKEEEESLSHILCKCPFVKCFWNNVMDWLKKKCVHIFNLVLTDQLIIFGCNDRTKTDPVFDLLLLLGKYFIYKCKCMGIKPHITAFKSEIKQRYRIEKITYHNNANSFNTRWAMYHCLFE